MELRERIADAMRRAEAEGAVSRAASLRLLTTAIRDRDLASRAAGGGGAADKAEVQAILARLVAQRRESAAAFEQVGRLEQAQEKLAEAEVLEEFLPRRLNEAEVEAMVAQTVRDLGATCLRDMGRVMSALRPVLTGHVDLAELKERVRTRLAAGS